MTNADDGTEDVDNAYVRTVNKAVGEVMAWLRQEAMTDAEFAERMRYRPVDITHQEAYERGTRPMPIATFLAECEALGLPPYEVMHRVAQLVEAGATGLVVDLGDMAINCPTLQLKRWAELQLRRTPWMRAKGLSPERLDEMAVLIGLPDSMLRAMLAEFISAP